MAIPNSLTRGMVHVPHAIDIVTILCLTPLTTVTSARFPDKDACHRAPNSCIFPVFSHTFKKEHRD